MKSRMRTKTKTLKASRTGSSLESIPRAAYKSPTRDGTKRLDERALFGEDMINHQSVQDTVPNSILTAVSALAAIHVPLSLFRRHIAPRALRPEWVRRGARRGRLGRSFFGAVVPRAGARSRRRAARASRAETPSPPSRLSRQRLGGADRVVLARDGTTSHGRPRRGSPRDPDEPGPRAARRSARARGRPERRRRRCAALRAGRGLALDPFARTPATGGAKRLAFSTPATTPLGPGAKAAATPASGLKVPGHDGDMCAVCYSPRRAKAAGNPSPGRIRGPRRRWFFRRRVQPLRRRVRPQGGALHHRVRARLPQVLPRAVPRGGLQHVPHVPRRPPPGPHPGTRPRGARRADARGGEKREAKRHRRRGGARAGGGEGAVRPIRRQRDPIRNTRDQTRVPGTRRRSHLRGGRNRGGRDERLGRDAAVDVPAEVEDDGRRRRRPVGVRRGRQRAGHARARPRRPRGVRHRRGGPPAQGGGGGACGLRRVRRRVGAEHARARTRRRRRRRGGPRPGGDAPRSRGHRRERRRGRDGGARKRRDARGRGVGGRGLFQERRRRSSERRVDVDAGGSFPGRRRGGRGGRGRGRRRDRARGGGVRVRRGVRSVSDGGGGARATGGGVFLRGGASRGERDGIGARDARDGARGRGARSAGASAAFDAAEAAAAEGDDDAARGRCCWRGGSRRSRREKGTSEREEDAKREYESTYEYTRAVKIRTRPRYLLL